MSTKSLLSLIHNKNILDEILSEVPFEKLLRISQRNKFLQKKIKISLEIYKIISKKKNSLNSICLLIDKNEKLKEMPEKVISKFIEIPFMAYEQIKVSYENSIEFICQVTEKQYTYLLCGHNNLFLSTINFKNGGVYNLEILNKNNEKILNSIYPTKLGDGIYLFNSKFSLFGINLIKDDNNLIASELYNNQYNKNDLLSITTITKTSFLVSSEKGDCLYFILDPIFLKAKLIFEIKDKNIFSYLNYDNDLIITYSGNIIYLISILNNGEITNKQIPHQKEIFTISINKTKEYIASGGIDGTLIIWKINSNRKFIQIKHLEQLHSKLIFDILPLNNGDFCSCGQDSKLFIFDTKKLSIIVTFNQLEHAIGCAIELKDERICVSSYDNRITIFNKSTGNVDAILNNLFSVPKFMIENDNFSIIICKFNQCVDIIGCKIEFFENNIDYDDTGILIFDVNEAF